MRPVVNIIIGAVCLFLSACTKTSNEPTPVPEQEYTPSEMQKSLKRGVAFGKGDCPWYDEDLSLMSPALSWSYNWSEQPQDEVISAWFDANKMDYCPMAWNGNYNANRLRNYVATHPGCKYLLAFNEPNLKDQARMTPQQAAAQWPALKALAQELNLQLVSPAMNYGTLEGYSDPIKWLDEFFACDGVSVDDVSAMAVHCYMATPGALKSYVERFAKYNKPVWVTEFCAWEAYAIHSEEDQIRYMCEVLHYMEQSSLVERYAWFIPRAKTGYPYMQLLTDEKPIQLTNAGKVYCGISSMDTTAWLDGLKEVSAADYIQLSSDAIQVRPSSRSNHLMLYSLSAGQKVSYQICLTKEVSTMTIHYSSPYTTSQVLLYHNDALQTMVDLPKTEEASGWGSVDVPVSFAKGDHVVRIGGYEGDANIDGFIFK